MRKPNLPPALVRSFALALPLVFGCQSAPGPAAAGNEADPATPATGPEVAKISKIRGNRGVTSPDLPDGAFLGEGATIRADQWLELPRGTRVELELAGGCESMKTAAYASRPRARVRRRWS
jgi:hypothetical protein